MALHARTSVARSQVTFIDVINVNSNKVVFSANDRVLTELLRQEKRFVANYKYVLWNEVSVPLPLYSFRVSAFDTVVYASP